MAEALLKKLVAQRGYYKAKLTRFGSFLEGYNVNNPNLIQLQTRLDAILNILADFDNVQIEIEGIDGQTEGDHNNERAEFEQNYFELVARAKGFLVSKPPTSLLNSEAIPGSSQNSEQHDNISHFNIKLPQINLPEYSGSYDKWVQFHDTFESLINKNPLLSKIQKFYYLQAALKGEAAQVIESLTVSEANYEVAWKLLTERFQNKRAIINAHIKGIFDLPNLIKESHVSLRTFLDTFLRHFRSLSSLGENVKEWNTILIYLLNTKLDVVSKREWETFIKDKTTLTVDDFTEFLSQRCRIIEALNPKSHLNDNFSKKSSENKYSHFTSNQIRCTFCQGPHYIHTCKKLIDLPVSQRYTEIKRLRLCTNCLRFGHSNSECQSGTCKLCQKRHNSLLHRSDSHDTNSQSPKNKINSMDGDHSRKNTSNVNVQNDNLPKQVTGANGSQEGNYTITSHCSHASKDSFVILSTALVYVYDKNNKPVQCRALLDSGSQSNFVTKELAERLGLGFSKINQPISGISTSIINITRRTDIKIKSLHNEYKANLSCLIMDKITDITPQRTLNQSNWNIPRTITLADPTFCQSAGIDLLLGASIFFDLLCVGQIKLGYGQPILHKTKLGWIVSGEILIPQSEPTQSCLLTTNIDLQEQLERFWRLEETYSKPKLSKEEEECEMHFKEHTGRDATGRFIVKLPLRDNYESLGDSHELSLNRFYSIERKLKNNPQLKVDYVKFMREYESLGHMTQIDPNPLTPNTVCYLPHHSVEKQDSSTTRLRIVFDASARTTSGLSLNDVLKVGPVIQNDLFSIVTRFRKHKVVMTGDIAKMYRQIEVHPSQRSLQQIIWRETPEFDLKYFQLNTVTYGTSSASFLATRCLKQVAIDNVNNFPLESNIIMTDFYMDDLLTGSDDCESLIQIRKNISDMLSGAGFTLRKFTSNDSRVLQEIAQNENSNLSQYIITDNQDTKALGIVWNHVTDTFEYKSQVFSHSPDNITKRTILSYISRLFDPLGLLGPVIIQAKIILQRLWQLQVTWDESLPIDLHTSWLRFCSQLSQIDSIRVPRHVVLPGSVNVQIHGFCDSSLQAYGCCVYIRCENQNGDIQVRLLCAKSRVAPLKAISLPRLELSGALLLAQLVKRTATALDLHIHDTFYWTDSTIVLSWITAEPHTWQTFVCNRVAEIQELSYSKNWQHVSSSNNPADIISRGISPRDIINSTLWWNGPSYLSLKPDLWPDQSHISRCTRSQSDIPEYKRPVVSLPCTISIDIFERFSNFPTLQRVIAYCLRFIKNLKLPRETRTVGNITVREIADSTRVLVKIVQEQCYHDDLKALKANVNTKSKKLSSLNPFLDEHNIIRVGGRLRHSSLPFNHKHPILLPSKHPFTTLIIQYEHRRNFHSGIQATLAFVRQKFWPIDGKQTVRAILRKCIPCVKANPSDLYQQMGELPSPRITPSRIFSSCGVDYAGPFSLKDGATRNRKIIKGYVCIFVCLASKAIHLELASELTTECFMSALKRFVSRRGLCRHVYSDNGTNFIGANNELRKINRVLQQDNFKQYLNQHNIEWHFIPARSPHFGGLWEAGVKSVKRHLKQILNNVYLTYEQFYTFLVQVESVLNSRPLIPLSSDPNDLEAITPGHFIIGEALNSVPQVDIQGQATNYRSQYKHVMQMSQHFWSRWTRDYLHNLQQRGKWKFQTNTPDLKGALVILKDKNTPPLCWPLGRITDVHPGSDGIVRVVSVLTRHGTVKRAIVQVCILPIS